MIAESISDSERSKNLDEFSLDISRPKLSDSESSDEEVYIKELDLKSNEKVKMEKLNPDEGKWPKGTNKDNAELSERKARASENDNNCVVKGTARYIELSHQKENSMEVDDNFIRDNFPKEYGTRSNLCNDHRAGTSPLEDTLHGELVSEKTEKSVKKLDDHLAGNKTRDKVKIESPGKRKTRAGLKRQKNSDNKLEHEVSNQSVRNKKTKQVGKTISKGKRGKVVEQNQDQEIFLQNLPCSSKMNNTSEDSDSDESENEWEEVHGNVVLFGQSSLFCLLRICVRNSNYFLFIDMYFLTCLFTPLLASWGCFMTHLIQPLAEVALF